MPRFTVGARVRLVEEKTTGRIGTVAEVLSRKQPNVDFDRYRVEFPDGDVKILSDMELSPAGTSRTGIADANCAD
jgi:predicted alpha/beta-fold hydrolase